MANTLIGNWILFFLVMLRLVGELKAVAGHDSLTGLLNRRGFRSHIDSVLAPARSVQSLAVLLLDIDNFKTINDQHGHETGDRILTMMGGVMRTLGSPHIVPCPWGGEEFCFVVDNYSDKSLIELAERAKREFHRTTRTHSYLESGATVSIGLATMQIDDSLKFSKLVALEDSQLHFEKRGGRNRVCSATNSRVTEYRNL